MESTESTDSTEFGISLQWHRDPVASARLAEHAGFDYLFCGEHLAFHTPTTNAFVSLSVAAGATSSIRLLSAVTLLPLYPAALAAKLATALDVASNGRFVMGVGVGGEFPAEFEAVGSRVRERGARVDEALELIDALMTGDSVDFDGSFTTVTSLALRPPPVQKPRVPFWIAGRKEAAMRRAARFGDGWMPYLYTPDQLADSVAAIDRLCRDQGRDGWHGRNAVFAFTTTYDDGVRARRTAAERVGRTYRQDFDRLAGRYLVAGTPAECAARFKEYLEAGADVLLFRLACPGEDGDDMLRRIADEVVPGLK